MEKPAVTSLPIHELLQSRWSPRAFASEPVDPRTVITLFEAARWAPSAANMQPWRFIVAPIDDANAHERAVESLSEKNRVWAAKAPVLVIAVAKQESEPGKPNPWHAYDLGQSVAHLTFQASSMGLKVHQMGGINRTRARELFDIPSGFEPITAFAVGRQAEADSLPEDLRDRERASRTRLPLDETVFSGAWGKSIDATVRTPVA